ncbi:arginine--tRNA ligase [Paenibacillus sp. CAA11]|uniref:arginine--tRNA ligase n=1 Tax=Paenibacillus sp. CAA11 TaxID=1532905 RepID=UPI000D386BE7|nr:arginine--tRNA ligase [Paenibacillus sp. CAA11]AWB45211.1 arginine--tRNA ligase [Paenibacillus sp. CAA11]
MLLVWITEKVEEAVRRLYAEAGIEEPTESKVRVEASSRPGQGDYASSIAMPLAKLMRRPPIQIAEQLKSFLVQDERFMTLMAKVEVAAPGFLNMTVNWNAWVHSAYRKVDLTTLSLGKVVVEHTSINPNKSAHIGHLRNSCIGDTLVRMLRRTGSEVEVHNYIDDLGNQLADTVVGLLHLPTEGQHKRFGDFCWDVYSKVSQKLNAEPELAEERARVLHAMEEGRGNLAWVGTLTAERIVNEHLEEMKQFGIEYDLLVWESNIVREGFWNAAFERLKSTPHFVQETEGKLQGCWVLKQHEGHSPSQDEEDESYSPDKVLVRSNGILTYTAKDIAYHLWKFGVLNKDFLYKPFAGELYTTSSSGEQGRYGQADTVINVIDHRQEYPQAMVKQALGLLGYDKEAASLQHVGYGVVSLSPSAAAELGIDTSDGKASYAMSGRAGIGIKITDLLDRMERIVEEKRADKNGMPSREIAAAAIRYYLLRFNLQTEVVFDLQQATEITGNTGVYLLYAYARAGSVLSKLGMGAGVLPAPSQLPEMEKPEYALLRQIAGWPDTLRAAVQELSPNMVCSYAYELAALFNNFYAACPILKVEEEVRAFRSWLTSLFKATLGEVLEVLGLPAPDRM